MRVGNVLYGLGRHERPRLYVVSTRHLLVLLRRRSRGRMYKLCCGDLLNRFWPHRGRVFTLLGWNVLHRRKRYRGKHV